MGTEKLRGIVLREQAKGESNKQIVLLAQGVGRVLLSARGARRAKSKLLAATQLFCYADFVVYEGKGFYSVTQAELKNSFYGLRLTEGILQKKAYREPRGVWLSAFRRSTRTADLYPAEIYGGSHGHKAENTRFF